MKTTGRRRIELDEEGARSRILHAAEELFANSGVDGTSVRQIAEKADVPVGLINYYFGSKDGLYRAIFQARAPVVVEERRVGLAMAAMEDDPSRRLEMIVKAILIPMLNLRSREGINHFGLLLAREVGDPRSTERRILQDMFDPIAREIIDELKKIWPDRSHGEVHWAYQMIIGVMSFIMGDAGRIPRLSDGHANPENIDETLRIVVPLLLNGLASGSK
jgi:AcrR family transcriptional regulator